MTDKPVFFSPEVEGDEIRYKSWLRENRETGLVVNNFNYGDRLKIHKATCGTLRPPKIGTGKS